MKQPILVVMAAGIGSRYGGLKQTDPVGPNGELILDYSVYDAIQAGFKKVIFIINSAIKDDFQSIVGDRLKGHIEVEYAYQELADIPSSFHLPENRVKPLGTAHAVYCARKLINAPFAVINADDYYGRDAFEQIFHFLSRPSLGKSDYAMIGYELQNTVTRHGYVSRGICQMDADSRLTGIVERTRIELHDEEIVCQDTDGQWLPLEKNTLVSMNMWGFTPNIITRITHLLDPFLQETLPKDPLKSEFYLPMVVDQLIQQNQCEVTVLNTSEKWYGVTYQKDKALVVEAIQEMCETGKYPNKLWE